MLIEVLLIVADLIGLPLLCWLDPAGLYRAEAAHRAAERDNAE